MRPLVKKLRAGEQFLARGKVHGALAAVGTTVDCDPLIYGAMFVGRTFKVYKGSKKDQHHPVLVLFDLAEYLKLRCLK